MVMVLTLFFLLLVSSSPVGKKKNKKTKKNQINKKKNCIVPGIYLKLNYAIMQHVKLMEIKTQKCRPVVMSCRIPARDKTMSRFCFNKSIQEYFLPL